MGSHNFMVTALGSCVKWPLVQLEHVSFVVVFDLSYKRLTFHLEAKPTQMECHKLPFFAASNFFGVVVAGSTVNLTRHRAPFINKYNLFYLCLLFYLCSPTLLQALSTPQTMSNIGWNWDSFHSVSIASDEDCPLEFQNQILCVKVTRSQSEDSVFFLNVFISLPNCVKC